MRGTVQLTGAISRLGELYGLTPTEAKVAREFAGGHSYKEVAQRLRISEDTVRAHIKQIYPKTSMNRQSDLVRLVLSMSTSGV
jgi:DNA-binding CsgD family transcriptional regulator